MSTDAPSAKIQDAIKALAAVVILASFVMPRDSFPAVASPLQTLENDFGHWMEVLAYVWPILAVAILALRAGSGAANAVRFAEPLLVLTSLYYVEIVALGERLWGYYVTEGTLLIYGFAAVWVLMRWTPEPRPES